MQLNRRNSSIACRKLRDCLHPALGGWRRREGLRPLGCVTFLSVLRALVVLTGAALGAWGLRRGWLHPRGRPSLAMLPALCATTNTALPAQKALRPSRDAHLLPLTFMRM